MFCMDINHDVIISVSVRSVMVTQVMYSLDITKANRHRPLIRDLVRRCYKVNVPIYGEIKSRCTRQLPKRSRAISE